MCRVLLAVASSQPWLIHAVLLLRLACKRRWARLQTAGQNNQNVAHCLPYKCTGLPPAVAQVSPVLHLFTYLHCVCLVYKGTGLPPAMAQLSYSVAYVYLLCVVYKSQDCCHVWLIWVPLSLMFTCLLFADLSHWFEILVDVVHSGALVLELLFPPLQQTTSELWWLRGG